MTPADQPETPMTYPLTHQQIIAKRKARDTARFTSELNRLTGQRQDLIDEYQRVSAVYARHLERLAKKAQQHAADMTALAQKVTQFSDNQQPPPRQPG
jgi:ABC-type transporter Mla subunit MlaD